jgi:two-component system cell cycle sensor histidine kinase/response regulator CckA
MVFTELVIHMAQALLSARPGETATTLCAALDTLSGALDMERSRVYDCTPPGDFVREGGLGHGGELLLPATLERGQLGGDHRLAPVLAGSPVLLGTLPDGPGPGLLGELAAAGLKSLFIVPLKREQEITGLLVLERTGGPSSWFQTDSLGLLLLSGVIRAAIERIRAEQRLARLETSYRELFDSVSDPIYIQDAQGRFVDVNNGAVRLYGYPREYFLGKTPEFLSAPGLNNMDLVLDHVMAALGGEARSFDFWGIDRNGRVFPKEVRVYPGHYDNKPAIVAFSMDISERVAREKEVRQRDERAIHSQKLESLGVLAGGIAHDFNNLLQTVLGNAELALAEHSPDSGHAVYLRDVIQAANHAAGLCRQMLAYSGKGRFVLGRVDLGEEIRTIGRILDVARPPATRIVYDLPARPAVLMGDVAQVRQVLMNLLTNAMEAIGERPGTVDVRITVEELDPRGLGPSYFADLAKPGTFACLEVRDTGCGMDPGTLARLFDPFFTTKMIGRGLGLSAVLGIVRSHGGVIQVESTAGVGTLFRIHWPVVDEEPAPGTPPPVPPALPARRLRVLLADDQDATRRICRRQLERLGHQVCDAGDGHHAWLCFVEDPARWSLALLDQSMPGLTGVQLLKRILEIRPDLPVILMSGFDEGDVTRKLQADREGGQGRPGRVRFLQKPFTGLQLADCMAELLAGAPEDHRDTKNP